MHVHFRKAAFAFIKHCNINYITLILLLWTAVRVISILLCEPLPNVPCFKSQQNTEYQ